MRQRKFPCCKEPMQDTDIYCLIQEGGSSCPTIQCEHCGKFLTVYLNIDSVEVQDED